MPKSITPRDFTINGTTFHCRWFKGRWQAVSFTAPYRHGPHHILIPELHIDTVMVKVGQRVPRGYLPGVMAHDHFGRKKVVRIEMPHENASATIKTFVKGIVEAIEDFHIG